MKLYRIICLFALTAVAFSVVGCRKNVQNTTPLYGYGKTGLPPDDNSRGKMIEPPDKGLTTNPNPPVAPIDTSTGGIKQNGKTDTWPVSSEQPFKGDTVYFDLDKSTIRASETSKLDRIASEMKQKYQGKGLRIEGHCDERGTEEYNRSLGDRRALSIREYLVRAGINFEMVDTISYGEDRPAVPGHTDAAWSKNRRGEFIMLEPPK